MRFEITNVDVTEINPSLSVDVLGVIVILPPADVDQVMEGSGTPLAVQLNVTAFPSSPVTSMLASGSVNTTGARIRELITKYSNGLCIYYLLTCH